MCIPDNLLVNINIKSFINYFENLIKITGAEIFIIKFSIEYLSILPLMPIF